MEKPKRDAVKITVILISVIAAVLLFITALGILRSSPEAMARVKTNYTLMETPEPDESEAPEETVIPSAPPREYDESGSIYSPTGKLSLRADWHLTSYSDTELMLDLRLYLSSYSINIGEKNGVIRVCGKEYPFISEPQYDEENDYKHEGLLYELTVLIPVEKGETVAVPISASWDYNAGYGGIQYGTLCAEQTLTVRG